MLKMETKKKSTTKHTIIKSQNSRSIEKVLKKRPTGRHMNYNTLLLSTLMGVRGQYGDVFHITCKLEFFIYYMHI